MERKKGHFDSRHRKGSRTTLIQVAAAAGVAPATVSGILNHRADCYAAEATRERVLAVARQLGYRASPTALALQGKSTRTLGLVVPGIDIPLPMFSVFELTARQHGFTTLLVCTEDQADLEDHAIRGLVDRYVDGIAVLPSETGPHTELHRLAAEGFPIVTWDGAGRLEFAVDDVSIDQFHGGYLQARHLVEIGRRSVCVLNTEPMRYVNTLKVAGLEHGLAEAGCKAPTRMNLSMPLHTRQHWEIGEFVQIRDFLRAHRGEFNGLAAIGDLYGVAAIRSALELGLRVPEDLAVIGFNDIPLASQFVPPLSTIYDPMEQMGETAFQLLRERLTGARGDDKLRQVKIKPELRVRRSTAGNRVTDFRAPVGTVPLAVGGTSP
jgi:DNA-binding LacI/PurR family transcriptional regulator